VRRGPRLPEGDTIYRAARTLSARLSGKEVTAFRSTVPALAHVKLEGTRVESVEARGKNLQVTFDDGRVLTTHMKMTGSWHVYHPGERWFLPSHRARAVIEVSDCVAVCFSAPVVELHASPAHLEQARLGRLGPDILSPGFDASEAVARIASRSALSLGEALLDQSLLCGIGNVYKSETLFLERVSPFIASGTLPQPRLHAVVTRARTLMQQNLAPGSGMRTTRGALPGASRHWVYRRSGSACFVCETKIEMRRQGTALRSTYFCRRCQGVELGDRSSPSSSPGA
jgi:endonuclease-8